ncbi:unnamed protein product [Cuscuta epithymum]|uniref:Thioredoxin domain-containing protein n=1 Tax=Cuscuta epithymum TaxID=186058 RepID=A0AAV0DIU7_9ASTE|nr:unnamed protein product [Cuscuta epithymum]CAH9137373.1 unnamed protein product [Cuscuta epithymum]
MMLSAHWQWMVNLSIALLLLLLPPLQVICRQSVASEECHGCMPSVEWQTITKRNYSSEIRLHPHLLLLVTVPWSGESRSLMKELGLALNSEHFRFGSLKLRVLFRNNERTLAEALGANTGISVVYYQRSLFYKYRGRLRAQNILSSIHYAMSLLPEELPLKSVSTAEELNVFLGSTDKALLLLEFCGWTQKLLALGKNNGTDNGFGFNDEFNRTVVNESKIQKGTINEKMECDIDDRSGFIPHLNKFSLGNDSTLLEAEFMSHGSSTCGIKEFVHFKSFLEKTVIAAREFFLPPERLRFGVVTNKSLLSVLNVEDPGSWLMTLQVAGCPTCSIVFKEGNDLKNAIQTQVSPVAELEDDSDDAGLSLPANKPSVLLFVDRFSVSSTLRKESKKAIDAFRELALHYHYHNLESRKDNRISEMASVKALQALRSTSEHHRIDLFHAAQKINANDKMSFVIMNDGKHVSVENFADLQGSSFREILTHVLKQKELRLSTIAKGAGFQLLSEDLNIELGGVFAAQVSDHPDHASESPTSIATTGAHDSESFCNNGPSNVQIENAQPLVVQTEDQSDQPPTGNPEWVQEDTLDLDAIQVLHKANPFHGRHMLQPEVPAAESFELSNDKNFIEDPHVQEATDGSGSERIFEKDLKVDEEKCKEEHEKVINLEYVQSLAVQTEVRTNKPSGGDPDGAQEAILDLDMVQVLERETIAYGEQVAQPDLAASELSKKNTKKNIIEHSHVQETTYGLGNGKIFENTLEVDEKKQERNFRGSFFFCDGQYRLLRTLTGGLKVPSAVIVDPTLQQHFVLAEQEVFNHSLLAEFLDRFISGSLSPYQQSEPFAQSPRLAPKPPFVNQDFHEADSIPRVTANGFTELVLGNHSDSTYGSNSRSRDVLVLFSNAWCSFCQRMELVVREVYRAIQEYLDMPKTASGDYKKPLADDGLTNIIAKLPLIYLMDCTLNDCSLILKPLFEREVYPLLLLFPAESKNPVLYEGDVDVSEIIKFLAEHGNYSYGPAREKNPIRTGAGGEIDQLVQNSASSLKNLYHEVLLNDRMPKSREYTQISSSLNDLHQVPLEVVVGSMLIATSVLLNSHSFGESIILMVKGDHSSGFHGLVLNKRLNWESLDEIDEGLEFVKVAPLSFGGPVIRHGMPLVALTKRPIQEHHNYYPEVLPNIYFLDQMATLRLLENIKSGNESIDGFWFFWGFSSWDGNQLVSEIMDGAWTVNKGNEEQIGWPSM